MFPKPAPLPGNRNEILELIQHAADNSGPSNHPLHSMALQLCSSGSTSAIAVLRRLFETDASTLDARGIAGNTLLHCAAQSGSAELVVLLLSHQPSLCTLRNDFGALPHHLAACERVRALLRMAAPAQLDDGDCHMSDANAAASGEEEDDEEDEDEISLRSLPEEMLVHILQQLEEPDPLLRVRETCRGFRAVADLDPIWERLCWTTYRRAARTSCLAGTWREVYIEHTLLQGGMVKARHEKEREQRYLDRRSLAGLERLCRESVEAPAGTLPLALELP